MNYCFCLIVGVWGIGLLNIGCTTDGDLRRTGTGTLSVTGSFLFSKTMPGESQSRTVILSNIGAEPVTLTDFRLTAVEHFESSWRLLDRDGKVADADRNHLPRVLTIEPREALRISLRFSPQNARQPLGQLSFRTNSGQSLQRRMSLAIAGTNASGELHVFPRTVNFGRVEIGEQAEKSVVVSNLGTDAIHLDKIFVSGSPQFTVAIAGVDAQKSVERLGDPDGDGIPGLGPDRQIELVLRFRPLHTTPASGQLNVETTHNPQRVVIGLVGNAVAPCVRVLPTTVNFDLTTVGGQRRMPLRIESCGEEKLLVDALHISQGEEVFSLTEMPMIPTVIPARASEGERVPGLDLTVMFSPDEPRIFNGTLSLKTSDPHRPEYDIPIIGQAIDNECPSPAVIEQVMEVRPLDVVTLNGSRSIDSDGPDGRPVLYEWVVVQRPDGSTAQPMEHISDPEAPAHGGVMDISSTPTAEFFVDLAGEYVIELRVEDNLGATAPSELCQTEPARIRIKAVPAEAFHVQLTWDTPSDPDQTDDEGTDLDLHLRHPSAQEWFGDDGSLDCFYQNVSPDWGRPDDTSDNPSLDIDDVNGAGPENINIESPQNTISFERGYQIGVHYFSSGLVGRGLGDEHMESTARVRIFIDGRLAIEGQKLMTETNDFWHVADVQFDGRGGRVTRVDTMTQINP